MRGGPVDPALAEPRWGKPSPSVRFPSPTAAGGPVGGEGAPSGALPLHALLPALLIFLLGDPHLLESALGGGDISGQGGPGWRESRFLTLHPWRFGILRLPSPHSSRNHQLAPSPCPLLCIQRAGTSFIPFNQRCIHRAFTDHLSARSPGQFELGGGPAGRRPANLRSNAPYPLSTRYSVTPSGLTCQVSPTFPRKIFPPPSSPSDTT